jgi:hypothetical protein
MQVMEIAPFLVRGPGITQAFPPSRPVNGRRCHLWMHARRPIGPPCSASIRHSGITRSGRLAPNPRFPPPRLVRRLPGRVNHGPNALRVGAGIGQPLTGAVCDDANSTVE